MNRGKFITLLGVNNLGKTTQAKLLKERIDYEIDSSVTIRLKYPLYKEKPIGPLLNEYLRHGNPKSFSPREFQTLQALHRAQKEIELEQFLEKGENVVSEDYIGTSIAWGIGSGLDEQYLININSFLLEEDLTILLDGDRFIDSIENGHAHETNDSLTERVRQIHLKLAKKFNWKIVYANDSKGKVHENIWTFAKHIFSFGSIP